MVDRSDVSHFLSSVNSGSSSVMKPFSHSTLRQSQENSFENSPTSSGKSKRYPSATEALQAYINDFESSHPHMKYSRNVSELLPSKTTLKGSSRNADIKTEINRYKVKKLIDRSYREILRADNERQKAKALLATSRLNDSSSLISGQSTDISLNTDALLSAPPHPYPTRRQRNTLNRLKSGSLEDLASRRIQMPQRMASSYHTPSNTMQSSTPTKTGNTAQSTSPVNRGRPAPSWIDDLDSVAGHPAPSWIQDLDSSITHPVPSWIQDLDTASCAAPSWVQDIDVSNISTITQSSHQPWHPLSSHRQTQFTTQ
ncbi:uncharacterized protein [Ptychodera flava]|uniref:uncharacterized protein n=1 Tax=Ptychodera flava TaxID=63121 RepID=UPI003969F5AE